MGKLDTALGALNGLVGDYLARTGNGLATEMQVFSGGQALALEREPLKLALPQASPKLALLVHGSLGTEADWTLPDGSDYGLRLERDLGFTPLYLRYNSGRAIADNGAALARLLEGLVDAYPIAVEELVPIGFSMGGLVVRSACHVASTQGMRWLARVGRAIYVGTPHLGAPLERAGRVVARLLRAVDEPTTQLLAQLADLRSDGVKDLGDADLRHEDRALRVARFALPSPRHPVPLLPRIRHHLVAGSLSAEPTLALLFGDALVPVPSATDAQVVDAAGMAIPPERVSIFTGVAHPNLARDPEVYAQLRRWLEEPR